jgi:hypothetical protein
MKSKLQGGQVAINKKSLVSKSSSNSTTKSSAAASKPVTPGKMVPAMRLAKASLKASKAGITTAMTRF